jgi:hypothetical protein
MIISNVLFRCLSPSFMVNPSTQKCQLIPDCSVQHCLNGDCVVVQNNFTCNCFDGWSSIFCDVAVNPTAGVSSSTTPIAAIAAPVVILGVLLSMSYCTTVQHSQEFIVVSVCLLRKIKLKLVTRGTLLHGKLVIEKCIIKYNRYSKFFFIFSHVAETSKSLVFWLF